jgi:hypothetical protein
MTTKIPVALIFFRRRCVLEVLQRIRDYAPEELFLLADGGRTPKEHAQCQEVRQLVEAAIDWPCRVERLYSDRNLGCRGNIPRGITWAFSRVDRAVILEDDTVPAPDFFAFCAEMLERYADDSNVMTVSGTNHFPGHVSFGPYSYLFSGYAITGGYATWARAWRHYDADMRLWPAAKEKGLLQSSFLALSEQEYWQTVFEEVWSRTCKCDPYDFQWTFASFLHRGLSIVPRANLVTNIGGGPEATHTQQAGCKFLGRPVQAIDWPLKHPSMVVRNAAFDPDLGRYVWYGEPPTWRQRFRAWLLGLLPESVRALLRSLRTWRPVN